MTRMLALVATCALLAAPATGQVRGAEPEALTWLEVTVLAPDGLPAAATVELWPDEASAGRAPEAAAWGRLAEVHARGWRRAAPVARQAPAWRGETDAHGRVCLSGPGTAWVFEATAPGFTSGLWSPSGLAPGTESLDVKLMPVGELMVFVLDADGAPVEGAEVRFGRPASGGFRSGFAYGRRPPDTRSDDSGVARVPYEGYWIGEVAAFRAGERSESLFVPAAGPRSGIVLAFPGRLRLAGRCVDSLGGPVVGAKVRGHRMGSEWLEDLSDAEGRFELLPVRPGGYRLTAESPAGSALAPAGPVDVSVINDGPTETVELVLRAEGVITGRVVDESGRPCSGLSVAVVGVESAVGVVGWAESPLFRNVETGGDGEFRIGRLDPDCRYDLRVRDLRSIISHRKQPAPERTAGRRFRNVACGSGPLELVLDERCRRGGTITIRPLDGREGTPLAHASAGLAVVTGLRLERVFSVNDGAQEQQLDPATGQIVLEGLDLTSLHGVLVSAPGHAPARAGPFDLDQADIACDIELQPLAEIRVRVVGEDGRPLPRAGLLALPAQDPRWPESVYSRDVRDESDADGAARFEFAAGESVVLQAATREGLSDVVTAVAGGDEVVLRVQDAGNALPGAALTVQVVDAGGAPRPGLELRLSFLAPRVGGEVLDLPDRSRDLILGPEGVVRVEGLRPGVWVATAGDADGWHRGRADIALAAGASESLVVRLSP